MEPKTLHKMAKQYKKSNKKIDKGKHVDRHKIANDIRDNVNELFDGSIFENIENGNRKINVYDDYDGNKCKDVKKSLKILDNYGGFKYKLKKDDNECNVFMKI